MLASSSQAPVWPGESQVDEGVNTSMLCGTQGYPVPAFHPFAEGVLPAHPTAADPQACTSTLVSRARRMACCALALCVTTSQAGAPQDERQGLLTLCSLL